MRHTPRRGRTFCPNQHRQRRLQAHEWNDNGGFFPDPETGRPGGGNTRQPATLRGKRSLGRLVQVLAEGNARIVKVPRGDVINDSWRVRRCFYGRGVYEAPTRHLLME
ncbi:hypothetical protein NDU88_005374 [Pleurodeles waltl]|uniref:Uncharacterized protein n=1 Tax=Pleurodeles waltl TaxID=8319 RepID=A0AAV7TV90_PLEWA|nr:hypothetical protein NDU88_005374 [Pleurodeles waltl]